MGWPPLSFPGLAPSFEFLLVIYLLDLIYIGERRLESFDWLYIYLILYIGERRLEMDGSSSSQ